MSDLISRKAALYSYQFEVCNKVKCYECKATDEDGTCKLERWIKKLPSAERRGRWIVRDNDYIDDCECSECGCVEYFNKGWKRFNYCPNCGAQMEVEA